MAKYNLKKPCPYCPFRNDIRPFIRPERAREIAEGDGEFPCHKTLDYDNDEGEGCETDKTAVCAGYLILREKIEHPSQMMRISERLGMYNYKELDMDSPVYDDIEEMVEAHEEEIRR